MGTTSGGDLSGLRSPSNVTRRQAGRRQGGVREGSQLTCQMSSLGVWARAKEWNPVLWMLDGCARHVANRGQAAGTKERLGVCPTIHSCGVPARKHFLCVCGEACYHSQERLPLCYGGRKSGPTRSRQDWPRAGEGAQGKSRQGGLRAPDAEPGRAANVALGSDSTNPPWLGRGRGESVEEGACVPPPRLPEAWVLWAS